MRSIRIDHHYRVFRLRIVTQNTKGNTVFYFLQSRNSTSRLALQNSFRNSRHTFLICKGFKENEKSQALFTIYFIDYSTVEKLIIVYLP